RDGRGEGHRRSDEAHPGRLADLGGERAVEPDRDPFDRLGALRQRCDGELRQGKQHREQRQRGAGPCPERPGRAERHGLGAGQGGSGVGHAMRCKGRASQGDRDVAWSSREGRKKAAVRGRPPSGSGRSDQLLGPLSYLTCSMYLITSGRLSAMPSSETKLILKRPFFTPWSAPICTIEE